MNALATAGLCLVSLSAGVAVGYFVAQKRLGDAFDERLEQEIDQAKKFYRQVAKVEEFSTPQTALAAIRPELMVAAEALTTYQGRFDETKVEVPVAVRKNIFTTPDPDVEWELLKRNRTEEAPYVLTQDEFMQGELEYAQVSLTYYAVDQVLSDDRDDVIEDTDADELIGLDNLKRFGLQTQDPDMVYVRNHVKELDIEIKRREDKFSEVVLGLET